jgi:hypothetical protein
VAGVSVTWTCKPGYTPIGNATLTCNTAGNYNGYSLYCLSDPPLVPSNITLTVLEKPANNTLLGLIPATAANAEQDLVFTRLRQTPFNGTWAFEVNPCSGAIRVIDPSQLDYRVNPVFQ